MGHYNVKPKGFTLIELVVVIVILGILAATVAPKFIDLSDDAKTASLQAVKASLESAGTLVYSKSLIKGNQKAPFSDNPTVTLDDGALRIVYGYPIVPAPFPTNAVKDYWDRLLELDDDFSYSLSTSGELIVYFTNSPTTPFQITANCIAYYTQPSGVGAGPVIQVNPC